MSAKQKSILLVDAVESMAAPLPPPGPKFRRTIRPPEPSSSDPTAELRRLTKQHRAWTMKKIAMVAMVSDRENRETGATIPCDVPQPVVNEVLIAAKTLSEHLTVLERAMTRELRQIPIYDVWLQHVWCAGPIVASYLLGEIDIHKAVKSSALRRFCGLAVIDGRLERRTRGQKNAYNAGLRTKLFLMFASMWKNAAKGPVTTKYLDVWRDYKARMQNSERLNAAANTLDGQKGAKAKIHAAGWHKAADLFVEDLYIVWRSLEGLPVWPSYYASKLGYEHLGKIAVQGPKLLTVDEAIAAVGFVGATPVAAQDAAE
jgi:hypothetical protein